MVDIKVKRMHPDAVLPTRAHEWDAGFDLYAIESDSLMPSERKLVGTGIAFDIPAGYVGLVTPRSGLSNKHGISLVNTPGVVDAGYQGEIKLNLINHSPLKKNEEEAAFHHVVYSYKGIWQFEAGDRLAQIVFIKLPQIALIETNEFDDTERGANGWGSSG